MSSPKEPGIRASSSCPPPAKGQKKSPYEKGQMRGKFITLLVYHICIHYARYFSENFPLFFYFFFITVKSFLRPCPKFLNFTTRMKAVPSRVEASFSISRLHWFGNGSRAAAIFFRSISHRRFSRPRRFQNNCI